MRHNVLVTREKESKRAPLAAKLLNRAGTMDLQVLIVGGGIHGVGLLHDLASRGITCVHLVERRLLASGTSSRSTKLLHGGLRYLEHLGQWPLVREALRERTLMTELLAGIVRPLPFLIPCARGGRPPWMIRTGLWLYDSLSGRSNLPRARKLSDAEVRRFAPYLPERAIREDYRASFLYYDAQMNDDVIVRLVASAAGRLGASYAEHTVAEKVTPISGGFRVDLAGPGGRQTLTTRTIVNAAGTHTTANLLRWGFSPRILSLLNVGTHLVFNSGAVAGSPESAAATLFQNRDGRVVFFVPWFGRWLLGTTESVLAGDPAKLTVPAADKEYLLEAAKAGLELVSPDVHLAEAFAGIRMMPVGTAPERLRTSIADAWRERPFDSPFYLRNSDQNISGISRETVIDECEPGLLSVYGGKFTTYRAQCEKIGSLLAPRLGVRCESGTKRRENWFLEEIRANGEDLLKSRAELRQLGG